MSAPTTYYVKGRFEGHFKTKQRSFLKSDEPFPKGDEHLVQIYRGIVSQSEEIGQQEFQTLDGFYNFREIQNVQVNTSNHWPVANDRIFSLTNAKLVNVKVTNVQQVGDQTLGEIQADVISEVVDGKFIDQTTDEQDPIPDNGGGNPHSGGDDNGNSGNGNSNDDGGNNGGGDSGDGRSKKGCFNWFPNFNWLRWLLYLLAILLLLYILGRCTQFTQKIYCKIKDKTVVEELKELRAHNDSLQDKINNTTLQIEPCGGGVDFEGSNLPWSRMVDIGEQSGRVQIDFNAKTIPDRLEVIYDGKIVAESKQYNFEPDSDGETFWYLRKYGGFTQGDTTFYFDYQYNDKRPTHMLIRVIPNRMYSGTLWKLTYSCPQ